MILKLSYNFLSKNKQLTYEMIPFLFYNIFSIFPDFDLNFITHVSGYWRNGPVITSTCRSSKGPTLNSIRMLTNA